jgi:Flp pilus assembly protein TadG
LVARFTRDEDGAVLVEYTVVFPLFILLVFGLVDVTSMFAQFAAANKAAYMGARAAIVSDPIAQNINDEATLYTISSQLNDQCFNSTTGVASSECPDNTVAYVCTSTGCTPNTYGFNSSAFTNANGTGIYDKMKRIYPSLQPGDVTVTYQFNGNGYYGMPGGLPVNVTVNIANKIYTFYFMGPILQFFGGPDWGSVTVPTFASTLTSEDLTTN